MVHFLWNRLNGCGLRVTRPHVLLDAARSQACAAVQPRWTVFSAPEPHRSSAKKLGSVARTHRSGTEQYRNFVKPIDSGAKRIGFSLKRIGFGLKCIGFGSKCIGFGSKCIDFGSKRIDFGSKRLDFGSKR